MILCHSTASVCIHEPQKIVNLFSQLHTFIGFGYLHPLFHGFKDDGLIVDIVIGFQSLLTSGKGLMGHDPVVPGTEQQCVASNAGCLLISPAEAAVDNQQLTTALDGTFALSGLYRNMTVDNVAVRAVQTKFTQQHIADSRIVVVGIVGILGLCLGTFIQDEPPFKSSHPFPSEDGAVPACPKPPQEVHAEFTLFCSPLIIVSFSGSTVGIVHEFLTGSSLTADGEGQELSVFGHGYAAVKQQIAIVDFIEATLGIQEPDMPLKLFRLSEGFCQLIDDGIFFCGQFIGMLGVHRGEIAVFQMVDIVPDGDGLSSLS